MVEQLIKDLNLNKLEFIVDQNGNSEIADQVFEGQTFSEMTLSPTIGKQISLSNLKFINCTTSPGTCVITDGVILNNVLFENFDCGDALRISSEADINEIRVVGEAPSLLIAQPDASETYNVVESVKGDYAFDVSKFFGRVNLYGFRGELIRKDPERHVIINSSNKDAVDWNQMGIGGASFWRIILKKLERMNALEGVFSLPDQSAKIIEEYKKLLDVGICLKT